jgi:lambda family phage portal protein
MLNAAQASIFARAVNSVAAQLQQPLLYGPDNKPLAPTSAYTYQRTAAQREGSMKNWIPRRLAGRQAEALHRERIVERSIDLTNNDPHASGIVDSFATTVVGAGLLPHPMLDGGALQMEKDELRAIQDQQRGVYQSWQPYADAGGRMTFGAIQFLAMRSLMQFGEYLVLLPMLDDPSRPYSLACQVVNPLRLRTPVDRMNDPNLRDGVEIGPYGEPVAYWIKKSSPGPIVWTPDVSANFLRIPAKVGHRWNVLHDYIVNEPEQVRGWPFFAPVMKYFRDFNDLLDAELVSNIVTAALAVWIELAPGNDPLNIAQNLGTLTETRTLDDGRTESTRYQEMIPGAIFYGNSGEKPHLLSATRPGVTFEPFTKIIKKAISTSLNIPYPVLFKDPESVNFAGFRSAMLDAWRVFMHRRTWLGQGLCQRVYTLLQEEAWLRGDVQVKNFYTRMHVLTRAEWRGAPKGDIEPIKAAEADLRLIQGNLKTRAEAIAERGGDLRTTLDQLQEEQEMMAERGLTEAKIDEKTFGKTREDKDLEDMAGAGSGLDQS